MKNFFVIFITIIMVNPICVLGQKIEIDLSKLCLERPGNWSYNEDIPFVFVYSADTLAELIKNMEIKENSHTKDYFLSKKIKNFSEDSSGIKGTIYFIQAIKSNYRQLSCCVKDVHYRDGHSFKEILLYSYSGDTTICCGFRFIDPLISSEVLTVSQPPSRTTIPVFNLSYKKVFNRFKVKNIPTPVKESVDGFKQSMEFWKEMLL